MTESIILTLPKDLRSAMDDVTSKEGLEPDELVYEALRQYFFQRQFRSLRERMIPKAREQGIYTDQDVFDQIS
jgi:hypothetical protein